LALQSFKKSLLDFPETRFIIAGPDRDGYTGHLQAMAIRAGISDRVLFSGYLDDRARITALVDADVFILPSHSENFGMAIMEAMAVGLPVITSDQVGISEYLANHQAGVVAPLDPQLISNEISRLLASAELRALYGGNARRVVRDFFSPDKVASQMLEHFQRIINKAFRN
jgi:glycosyltransferase involved in cell wall biosynthesis